MKKEVIKNKKSFVRISPIVIVLLVVFTLISSSSISLTLNQKNENFLRMINKTNNKISNGPAPPKPEKLNSTEIKYNKIIKNHECPLKYLNMYGYRADPDPEYIINFNIYDPGTIEIIAPTQSDNFIAGGTCIQSYEWIGCEYGTGKLWIIDYETGEMVQIGGGGENLNGLALNPMDNRLYGSGDDNYLYEIDPDTGEQEIIGAFGNGVEYMIGMAFDADGVLYGWDLGNDKLWTIDTDTGESTEVGSLGIDLNYAQDGDFCRETDVLYLTAYTDTGQLYICDEDTGECELIDNFEDGAQITASLFDQCWCYPTHDIALKSIDYPISGNAEPDMKMQITVENTGLNTETFDAQMLINYNSSCGVLMDENFSGTFPPDGWETDCWEQCWYEDNAYACFDTSCSSEDYSITSKPINASEYDNCYLRFRWGGDYYYPHYVNIYVKYRMNSTSPWKDVTPWDNPVGENQDTEIYEIGIYGFGEPLGEAIQIKWEPSGYYYYFNNLYLDDVYIEAFEGVLEYAEIVEDITLQLHEVEQIEFPTWTPSQWLDESYENSWEEYNVYARVLLEGDQNPRNDNKSKFINLYFGFFDDVGCNNISEPKSGPAQTLSVISHVKNFGQYNESNFETNVEIAELDMNNKIELINEDFSESTFPPDGWIRTHENWKYSYSDYAEGVYGEARFYYYPYSTDIFRLISPLIDTSEYEQLDIEFKQFIDHYQEPYILSVEISEDGVNWNVLWNTSPTENIGPETVNLMTFENISSSVYISWTFTGFSYYIDNWYIDDIIISGIPVIEPEYEDNQFISIIEPAEEIEVEFDDWTPSYLSEETTGKKQYIAKSWTNLNEPIDQNPYNDLFKKLIIIDYFHDVGIKTITSPSNPCKPNNINIESFPPMPELYLQPGTEHIEAIVENNGTFPAYNLTCNAQIWDFIENHNGTLLYEDEITDIDLEEPVGGTKLLTFDDFTFTMEGVHGLYLDFPYEKDDFTENNNKYLVIGVDDTPPIVWIEGIDPEEPNGENGWYVDDILITICAEDPEIQEGVPGSGVCGFYYSINGGSAQFVPGDCFSFIFAEDGEENIVEFWAVDCVGNISPKYHIIFNMDQTVPDVVFSYELLGWTPRNGWLFEFTAIAVDAMSGMDRVEFFLNNELQEIIEDPGPEYIWTLYYTPIPGNAVFRATAYDKAGLFESDEIKNPKTNSHSYPKNKNIFTYFQKVKLPLY
jgi:hypothetical protein